MTPTPNWVIGVTASAGASNLRVQSWNLSLYDANGGVLLNSTGTAASFSQSFNQCGPGSSQLSAQADACTAFCVGLGGKRSGTAQFSFTALDDAGRSITATSTRTPLSAPR